MNEREREYRFRELFGNTTATFGAIVQLGRHTIAACLLCAVVLLLYAANVFAAWRSQPTVDGTISTADVHDNVLVRRDDRGVPHIAATSEHDLFFAQGFVEGSDRLFQMELTRRYALGQLAEIFGPKLLPMDEVQRSYDVPDIARRQLRALSSRDRDDVEAFSAGVNKAMRTLPLPVEFRILMYEPQPWAPSDCLAISIGVSIALADSWRDVLARDSIWRRVGPSQFDQYVPLSDPMYDVTSTAQSAAHVETSRETPKERLLPVASILTHRAGSNAWAAGAAHTSTRRALLANDPHVDLTIPGLWYLIDLKAPGFRAAGASIPGTPGVLLGHNERIAWGATNSDATSLTLFRANLPSHALRSTEIFHVRFGADVRVRYYRTASEFSVPSDDDSHVLLARWPAWRERQSVITTFLDLDRAHDAREALGILSRYTGAAENFIVADTLGNVQYHLAGSVVNDPAWGRYVHPNSDLMTTFSQVPFAQLPSVAPSRDALVISANNKMYGAQYPYRLAATFDPPYRAHRIAEILSARRSYDVEYFSRIQLDAVSPIDREFARAIAKYAGTHARELATWDGSFIASSQVATLVHTLRNSFEKNAPSLFTVMQQLRSNTHSADIATMVRDGLFEAGSRPRTWESAGAVRIEHPLSPLWLRFLNGVTLPGNGDEYTIHVQEDGFAQSFRAVWDVGNWDAGGISIPSGESGAPGSGHYTDLAASWIAGRLEPLPFSERAVNAATRHRLMLTPEAQSAAHNH